MPCTNILLKTGLTINEACCSTTQHNFSYDGPTLYESSVYIGSGCLGFGYQVPDDIYISYTGDSPSMWGLIGDGNGSVVSTGECISYSFSACSGVTTFNLTCLPGTLTTGDTFYIETLLFSGCATVVIYDSYTDYGNDVVATQYNNCYDCEQSIIPCFEYCLDTNGTLLYDGSYYSAGTHNSYGYYTGGTNGDGVIYYDTTKWCLSDVLDGECLLFGKIPCNDVCPDLCDELSDGACYTTTTTTACVIDFEAVLDCNVPTVTPTPTPTRTVTPTPTPTLTGSRTCSVSMSLSGTSILPNVTLTPTPTLTSSQPMRDLCFSGNVNYNMLSGFLEGCDLTPLPTPTATNSVVVPTCSILVNYEDGVYSYNLNTNITTFLGNYSPVNSYDIAHTTTKMWLYETSITEYDITLSPWSASYSRTINYPVGVDIGSGLHAINNNTLITSNYLTSPEDIISIDITTTSSTSTILFSLQSGRKVTGDILKTVDNKYIITNDGGGRSYITQYDSLGNLEVDKDITDITGSAYGVFEENSLLYIIDSNGQIYNVDINYPYTVSAITQTTVNIFGASQISSCINVSLICNPQCAQVLLSNNENIYVYDACEDTYTVVENDEYSGSTVFGISNNENKLWMMYQDDYYCSIKEFNITYYPFTMSSASTETWTGTLDAYYSPTICATSSDTKFVSFNFDTRYFCEIDISTPGTYTVTDKFVINNVALYPVGNFILTTKGELIIVSKDTDNNDDIYLTVYEYSTGSVITHFKMNEFDGSYQYPLGLFTSTCNCTCGIYFLLNDDDGGTYVYSINLETNEVTYTGNSFPLISTPPPISVGQSGASQLFNCATCGAS